MFGKFKATSSWMTQLQASDTASLCETNGNVHQDDVVENLLLLLSRPTVFIDKELSSSPKSLDEWSGSFGVTREAIRRSLHRDIARMRLHIEKADTCESLRSIIEDTGRALQDISSTTDPRTIAAINSLFKNPLLSHPAAPYLVVWAAGPYELIDDCLVKNHAKYARLKKTLKQTVEDTTTVSCSSLTRLCRNNRLRTAVATTILQGLGWVEASDTDWMVWPKNTVDRAYILLKYNDQPLPIDVLFESVYDHVGCKRSFRNEILADDRFVKIDRKATIGLSEWGRFEPYEGLLKSLEREIASSVEPLTEKELTDLMTSKYLVTQRSVFQYLRSGRFDILKDGVSISDREHGYIPTDISHRKDVVVVNDRWGETKLVDPSHHKGYSFMLSMEVAARNNLKPGDSLLVPAIMNGRKTGEVSIIWERFVPNQVITVGRLRMLLQQQGISPGEELTIFPTPAACYLETSSQQ